LSQATRDTLLISHANPEDNEFTRWLALRLAIEGYKVWCDLTKLLGGEVFWDDIERVLRENAVKVLYVLSRTSNVKDGPLRELHLAQSIARKEGLRDFVIPLHIDDLPYGDVKIELTRVNATPFERSWATGLAMLLAKLEKEKVPKSANFNPEAVCAWWRSQPEFSARQGVVEERDEHLSNWFPITNLPDSLCRHVVTRRGIGKIEIDASTLPLPAANDTDVSFLAFAGAEDFSEHLPPNIYIADTQTISIQSIVDRTAPRGYPALLTQLLRIAWEGMASRTKLHMHELSNRAKCYYFTKGLVENDRLYFDGVSGRRAYRDVIGFSTRMDRLRYWHYGINAKPVLYPVPHFVLKGHVLFSNEGLTLWKSKEKLAKARRSQCKNWWNDEWRDRLLAVMTFLAGDDGVIRMPVGSELDLTIEKAPEAFVSPVSYVDPEDIVKEEDHDDYALEDEDSEEGDELEENE
jgi:hypothetical protein